MLIKMLSYILSLFWIPIKYIPESWKDERRVLLKEKDGYVAIGRFEKPGRNRPSRGWRTEYSDYEDTFGLEPTYFFPLAIEVKHD